MNTELLHQAEQSLLTAEYLFKQTYPQLQEKKLLLTVVHHLYLAADAALMAALQDAREKKRIPPFNKGHFPSKVQTFQRSLADYYQLDKKALSYLLDLHRIQQEHEKSPFEFSRKDQFVITNDDFALTTITEKKIKQYLSLVQDFVQKIKEKEEKQ